MHEKVCDDVTSIVVCLFYVSMFHAFYILYILIQRPKNISINFLLFMCLVLFASLFFHNIHELSLFSVESFLISFDKNKLGFNSTNRQKIARRNFFVEIITSWWPPPKTFDPINNFHFKGFYY